MVIVETLNLPSQHIGTVVKRKVSSCGHAKKRNQKKPQAQQLWLDLFLTQVSIIKPVKKCQAKHRFAFVLDLHSQAVFKNRAAAASHLEFLVWLGKAVAG